jgi:hypothetical protein
MIGFFHRKFYMDSELVLAYLWVGYFFIRLTTLPQIKTSRHEAIWTERTVGIGMCLFGVFTIVDKFGWLSDLPYQNLFNGLLTILFCCGVALAFHADLKILKKAGVPFFGSLRTTKERTIKEIFSLITWDMWVVSLLVFLFSIYLDG